jgi:hypothetical protein
VQLHEEVEALGEVLMTADARSRIVAAGDAAAGRECTAVAAPGLALDAPRAPAAAETGAAERGPGRPLRRRRGRRRGGGGGGGGDRGSGGGGQGDAGPG